MSSALVLAFLFLFLLLLFCFRLGLRLFLGPARSTASERGISGHGQNYRGGITNLL